MNNLVSLIFIKFCIKKNYKKNIINKKKILAKFLICYINIFKLNFFFI